MGFYVNYPSLDQHAHQKPPLSNPEKPGRASSDATLPILRAFCFCYNTGLFGKMKNPFHFLMCCTGELNVLTIHPSDPLSVIGVGQEAWHHRIPSYSNRNNHIDNHDYHKGSFVKKKRKGWSLDVLCDPISFHARMIYENNWNIIRPHMIAHFTFWPKSPTNYKIMTRKEKMLPGNK